MLLGGNEETKIIDNYAINHLHIPSIVLMENAAIAFMKNIDLTYSDYLVICGPGNNGGDGFAIARQLHSLKKNVSIFLVTDNNLSNDCQVNYNICRNMNINIIVGEIEKLIFSLIKSNVVIDAIFGTGLNSDVKGIYADIIDKINFYSVGKKIYSVDIPSGISGNTGEILGRAVKADETISFVTYKKAFLNMDNIDYFGNITIENIGLNENDIDHLVENKYLDKKTVKSYQIKRGITEHKGNFGRILIFAGSGQFNGAAGITTNACIRTGAGLVTLLARDRNVPGLLPEAMVLNTENFQIIENHILNSDVIAIGPGISKTPETLTLLKKILSYTENNKGNIIQLIIDADGINLIAENIELMKMLEGRAVITPHLVEFSRITGLDEASIMNDRFEITKSFAKKYNIVVLLKGKNTIITDGKQLYVNSTGNSHMANGGMGDALTGIITSLVGQKYSLLQSAGIGAYLHGYIGDKLSHSQYIINATHVIENIPKYLKEIFE